MNAKWKPVRVFEQFQSADGKSEYRWLWMYWVRGERRFALTEADAVSYSVAF